MSLFILLFSCLYSTMTACFAVITSELSYFRVFLVTYQQIKWIQIKLIKNYFPGKNSSSYVTFKALSLTTKREKEKKYFKTYFILRGTCYWSRSKRALIIDIYSKLSQYMGSFFVPFLNFTRLQCRLFSFVLSSIQHDSLLRGQMCFVFYFQFFLVRSIWIQIKLINNLN